MQLTSTLLLALSTASALLVGTSPRCATRAAPQTTMLAPTESLTVTLTGCKGGVGVGLDTLNYVDMLTPGLPAEAALRLGDKVTHWNGSPLWNDGKQVKLKNVVAMPLADSHTLLVERFLPTHGNIA